MVVSVNSQPDKNEFNSLLDSTIAELNAHAKNTPKIIELLKGNKLEPYVRDVMTELAIGSEFENSIELIGGQKFPDIIAKKYYGVEVKTTTQNHWKTTGNSILESTRVNDVERIFMLFGKLARPIEFRSRAYEECLSEVVVTHSPRFLIDMNLEKGKTIFDKIKTPYDVLRQKKNPIEPITSYYKSKLKPGQDLWWINQEVGEASNLIIKHYGDLTLPEKFQIRNKAMVYFPEIFGNSINKYKRVAIWLVTRQSIVSRNVRDIFTSGGQESFMIKGQTYINVPKAFINLFNNLESILDIMKDAPSTELSKYWDIKTTEKTKLTDWVDLVSVHSKTIQATRHLDLKKMLNELIFS